jgi:alpha-tubulin suppressor-like RCC1 family protein
MSSFDLLPSETVLNIALQVPLSSISSYCRTSKRSNNLICNNEYFWKLRFFKAHWSINNYTGSWKKLYEVFLNVWVCGNSIYGQLEIGSEKQAATQIPNFKAKQASVGRVHTVLINTNNNIWTFGHNQYGQLGLADDQDRNIPTQIPNLKAQQVSTKNNHTVLIDIENNIWIFGQNENRELGLGDNRKIPIQIPHLKAKQISTEGYHTILIDLEDNV